MYVYAGIDEAGYGPMFGPLTVARAVLAIPRLDPADTPEPPHLWQRLSRAVCRNIAGRKGRIPINDSKQLKTSAPGVAAVKHLELGCLAFAGLAGWNPATVCDWLDLLGETAHRDLSQLPWYAPCHERPWDPIPVANTAGEIAVARGLLAATARRIGVEAADFGAAAVFEDRFNQMVAATRSKAATSFTFVAQHLTELWSRFGEHDPQVFVDRQGGRQAYLEPLRVTFPDARIRVLRETPEASTYRVEHAGRSMRISFEVEGDARHMPIALASMIAKYTRELFMARFNAYFTARLPDLRPTAGYATDARRFWIELQPHLNTLAIPAHQLCRVC
jgi:hypothetical protein